MKKILLFFVLALLNLNVALSQGNSCASATPFCGSACFPNNTATTAPGGPAYGCLVTQPNPAWFFVRTTAAGVMTFSLDQNTTGCDSGSGIDVDFVCWGPFANMTTACANLTGSCTGDHACSGNIEDCSFSPFAVETMTINSPGAGNYYVVLITNFSDVAGYIDLNQTGGPATDCSILCPTVTSGNGFLQTNGTNMPASVACNSANLGLIASNNTPFGNPITPAIIISFTNNNNVNNNVSWYENGTFILCSGPAPCGLGLTSNAATDLQYSTMSPTATNLITLCEPNTTSPNIGPYTIIDAASGATIASGTWNDDGICTNISFPPGTITGVADWTVSPACPGCLVGETDWGYTGFSPSIAGAGTWNICYSFDPPGTCPTYTYCQSITVTDPFSAAWTTPPPMCSTAGAINLNTFVTGTPGGTWGSIPGGSPAITAGGIFTPSLAGTGVMIEYSVGPSPFGCGDRIQHFITVNPTPVLTITNSAPTICSGQSTNISLSSSVGGTGFSWTPPGVTGGVTGGASGSGSSISQILTTAASGTVTYTITANAAGCTSTGTAMVTVNPNPTVNITPASVSICAGASATLTANPSPGGGTYAWSTGATTSSISVSPASTTTYTVTYTLAGCTGTATRTITVNPTPTVNITPASVTICSGQSSTLTANPAPAGGTYSWSTGATTSSISVSPAGTTTYTVTYTLAGCSATATRTITVNPTPTVNITPASPTLCTGQSTTLTANPAPAGGTYSWSTGATTNSINVTPAGTTTYTVTYTLAGCTATATNTVTIVPTPTVSITPASVTICSGQSATLTANPVPAGGSYAWSTGATIASISVSPASTTTYTVTYTLGGCTATATRTITVNPTPTVTITPATVTICAGQSATLTANPAPAGGGYSWSTGATTSAITVSPASTTTYTVTYTLAGCTGTATRTITVNPMDNAGFNYGGSTTFCQTGTNPTATITGLPGGTFAGSPGTLVINASTGQINLAASPLGTYTVTYTTTGPCPNSFPLVITITTAPNAVFTYAGPYCQFAANPSPSYPTGGSAGTYTSTPSMGGSLNASNGQINLSTAAAGTYSVINTIPASGGCAVAACTVSVTINPTPVLVAEPNLTYCAGVTVPANTFVSNPVGATYSWTNSNIAIGLAASGTAGTPSFTASNATTSPITSTVTVTPAIGSCTGSPSQFTITVNPTPSIAASPTSQTICSGTSTAINFTSNVAGATFSWTIFSVTGVSGQSASSGSTLAQVLTATGSSAGTVTYQVTPSANGCSGTPINVVITVNPVPFATATPSPSSICSGASTGITLSSFTPSTGFTWTVPGYTGSVTGGAAGSGTSIAQILTNSGTTSGTATYTITPSAAGCTGAPITTTVTVFPVPNVTPSPLTQSICSGTATSITLSGTVAGTTYSWPAPTISPVGAITGGFGASGVGIGQTLTNSTASAATATYVVTPSANGCPGTPVNVVITVNPNPVISAIPAPSAICSGATSNIPLTSNVAGTGFSWTVGAVTGGVTGATAGSGTNIAQVLTGGVTSGTVTYNITALTPAGCTATTSAVITVNPVPVATATPSTLTMCSGGTTAINLTSTVSGTTYVWGPTAVTGVTGASAGTGSSIAQTLTATGTISGTLTYTITPSAGTCPGTPISVNVTVNPTPVITATPTSQTFCDGGTTNITLSSNVSGTIMGWTVVQSGVAGGTSGSGVNITDMLNTTGTSSGTATYTITGSAAGCPGNTVNVVVTVNPIDDASFTYASSTYCQTGPDPSATITGLAGGVFTVVPSTGLVILNTSTGLIDLSASTPGTYTITYQTSGACPNSSSINIDITNAPTAGFTYPTPVCSSDPNALPTFSGGSSAGTFSSGAGLSFVNVNTGEIDLAGSTAGTYTVYNSIAAAGGCASALDSAMITINMAATVAAGTDNTICEAATYTLAGSIGGSATVGTWTTSGTGTFSSTTSPTAVYTPSAADVAAGSVTLTFTTDDPSGVCGVVTDNMVLTITPLDNAGFTYGAVTTFCTSGTNPVPTITGLAGGTFSSSPAGLAFVSTLTGEINLSGSAVGTYDVYYTTAGVCPNSDTVSVTITTAPVSTFTWTTGASAFCQTAADPGPVFGTGASGGVFTATPAGIVIDGVTGIVDLSASAVGTYMVTNTIVAAGGCASSVDSLAITIDPAPIAEAGNNMTICAGSTATMANDSIGGSATTLNWTSSGTGTWTGATTLGAVYTPSAADIAAGSVTLYMTTDDPAGACGAVTDSITLTIDPTPPAPAVSNPAISVCDGSSVGPITATGTGGTFTWYSDAALTTIVSTSNPFNPGVLTGTTSYWVTETIGACQGPATQVTITVNPLPVVDTTAAVLTPADCGAPTGSVTGITMTSGTSPFTYQWLDGFGAPAGSAADLTGAAPGVYTLTITDANGCSVIAGPFTISSTAGVMAAFTANPTTGETPLTVNLTNASTGASSYIWYFGPYANNDTSMAVNPTYIITPLGLFDICLVAINSAGCMDTACVTIDVYINSVFVIPNVFTPNGDGTNDIFTVDAVGLESMDAEIFNRWGQKEYEWHTTNGGWDGRTASGVPAPDGTYYFIMKAKGIDGKEYKEHGAFTLVR